MATQWQMVATHMSHGTQFVADGPSRGHMAAKIAPQIWRDPEWQLQMVFVIGWAFGQHGDCLGIDGWAITMREMPIAQIGS